MQLLYTTAFLGTAPGPFELLLIFVVTLLLFGAKRMPEIARAVGKAMEELRRASQDFKTQMTEVEHDMKDSMKDVTEEVQEFTAPRDSMNLDEPDDLENFEPFERDEYNEDDYAGSEGYDYDGEGDEPDEESKESGS